MLTPRVNVVVARAPLGPFAAMDWPADEPLPNARLAPVTTWVLTRGLQPDAPEPPNVPSCCRAADPVPVALLTPTVTLVEDSGQPRFASIAFSSDEGLRRDTPPRSCAAAGKAASRARMVNVARC